MTNPTSNFGWQMPTSTDLVTDLPADFEVFGQAVDTSLADLKGGTTGQILSKATNADMDFTWITNDVGDITAVTAGTGLTGGGTSGAITVSLDTTSAYVLPSQTGNSGKFLTTNGTAASWGDASSITLLSTTSLSGASTTISGISGSYSKLFGVVYGVTNATADGNFRIAPNASTGITNAVGADPINNYTDRNFSTYLFLNAFYSPSQGYPTRTSADNTYYFQIDNYANTTIPYKPFAVWGAYFRSGDGELAVNQGGGIKTTSAISSLVFSNSGGNLSTGTVLLYGVK